MKFKSNLSVTIILVICSFVQSCSRYSPRLEAALSLAGENRVELEKLSSAAEKEQVLMGLRAKYVQANKRRYAQLNVLCRQYLESPNASRNGKDKIYAEVKEILAILDEPNQKELESMLDDNLDGIMTKLRAAIPDATEKDFRFISFLILGFDTKTIARMMGYNVNTVYTKRYNIKEMIARLDDEKKYVLTRSLLYSFAKLHSRSIVHADIKPDNILIKRTEAGFYTGKIIDFDSGFLEDSIPEEIQGDQIYLAPEVRLHMMEEEAKITTKIDIFALGILFHQYWSGRLPTILSDYDYVFESVLDDSPVFLDDSIPKLMRKLIGKMLNKNPELRPSAAQILKVLDTLLTSTAAPSDTAAPSGTKEREAYSYDVAAFSGKGGKGFHALGDL